MINDINFDLVGNLIIQLREKYGLNQQDFANEIGVSKGAVCQWEQGAGIKTENLYDIAKFFNITVAELINGHLNEETDDDYFERNYNLDDFEYFSVVNDENYDDLIEYLKRCKNVIKRFMMLYSLNLEDKLTNKQNKEYVRLLRYFKPDYEYADAVSMGSHVGSIRDAVEELTNLYKITDSKDLDYMLFKLFPFEIKANAIALLNYEKGEGTVNEYLDLIGKEQTDALLTSLVSELNEDEIEQSVAVRRLVERGARCLFTRKHINSYTYDEIEEDVFDHLDGVVENNVIQNKYYYFKQIEKTNEVFKRYNPYSWKNYTRDEYDCFVDKETTDIVRDIVLLKGADPKTYYANLNKRNDERLGFGNK